MTVLVTDRLTLRPPEARDWPAFFDYAMSPRAKYTGGEQWNGHVWRTFAAEIGHWQIRGYGMFIVTETGSDDAIGLVGPWYPVGWPEREVGWMMFTDAHEGKGYAREAAQAALDHVFGSLGWDTAVSYIAPANVRSRALAERLGASIDPEAIGPGMSPTLVYRHPRPEDRP
ncbi:GNAT family N-acetyltransferase [Pelagovum pacificum]|uniref:GNAT family N-acetyltransferase n=1 Tax=Pelagovum pacificum TaxID=2588711 RepID=A0A5C5GFB1_9RHOB|nr:GNAT family N-acetyltransferase [Pelagovum pacificum]QQA43435.1 GNAT family N-acetyltransferase [Pelagovum pacificum]TNY33428.1 GNAT family N-acetyltransferase [Pelagovum pacificum]